MKRIKFLFAAMLALVVLNGSVYGQDTTLTVTSAGNVGIGTTSPQATLEVHGAALIRETGFTGNAGGAGGGLELRGAPGTFAPGLALDNGSQQWNIVSWNDNSLKFIKSTGTTFAPFTINNNSFQDALVLAADGVGIGTTSPTAKLHIGGTAGVDGIKFPDGTLQTTAATGGSGLWSASGSDIFYNSGNVGIGTTAPRTQLHVFEGITTGGTLASPSAGAVTLLPPDGFAFFHIDNGPAGGRPTGRLRFSHGGTPGDIEIMTLTQAGRVGIGSNNPNEPLSFKNEIGTKINLFDDGVGIYGFGMAPAEVQIGTYDATKHISLGHYSGSNKSFVEWMRVAAGGNVGIGTTTPTHPLEMASGAHVTAGGVWTDASSRQYKENISNLTQEEAISALEKLNPVKFNYKVEKDEEYVGFIAEDVPDLVATKDRQSLSPMDIVAVLTKVVQQQQKKIAELEARLNASQ